MSKTINMTPPHAYIKIQNLFATLLSPEYNNTCNFHSKPSLTSDTLASNTLSLLYFLHNSIHVQIEHPRRHDTTTSTRLGDQRTHNLLNTSILGLKNYTVWGGGHCTDHVPLATASSDQEKTPPYKVLVFDHSVQLTFNLISLVTLSKYDGCSWISKKQILTVGGSHVQIRRKWKSSVYDRDGRTHMWVHRAHDDQHF